MADRPDLTTIRTQYQAPDDEVIDYRPRAFGAIDIPFTDRYAVKVTKTEGALLDELTFSRGLMGLRDFSAIKDRAFSEAETRFPDTAVPADIPAGKAREWQGNDGHRDAFRHAYWNALLAHDYGNDWARSFATAHEGLPGNPATREAMDLYNNEVGRSIGASHPNASREELANLVADALNQGKLVVVGRDHNLQWSDRVARGQHGLTTNETLSPHLDRPNVVAPTSEAPAQNSSSATRERTGDERGVMLAATDAGARSTVAGAIEDHPLYASLRSQLPGHVPNDKAAELTVDALRNGITTPQQLGAVTANDDRIFAAGTTPGFRATVDLNQPAPPAQQMQEQMAALSRAAQVEPQTQGARALG